MLADVETRTSLGLRVSRAGSRSGGWGVMSNRKVLCALAVASLALGASCSNPKTTPEADTAGDVTPHVDTGGGGDADGAGPDALDGDGGSIPCLTHEDCEAVVVSSPCQVALCDGVTRACVVGAAKDYVPCDDGNACSQEDYCLAGACTPGAAVVCDDGDPCTDDACDPLGSCMATPNTAPCDDGNACTDGDVCQDGACAGTPQAACACVVDGDCAAFEDGDLCNGTLACIAGTCQVDQTTPVVCPAAVAGGCTGMACLPQTGECAPVLLSDVPCSDGNPCSVGDRCEAGACVPGLGACECATTEDCAIYEDDDKCNGTLECDGGHCEVDLGSVPVCTPSGPCDLASCTPATGECAHAAAADGTACSDGAPCTVADHCAGGVCAGVAKGCDDGNPCTDDGCDSATGECVHAANTLACDDEDPCTEADVCADGSCAGQAKSCEDDDVCTEDGCDPGTGDCVHAPLAGCCLVDGDCDDGDGCTSDTCDLAVHTCLNDPIEGCCETVSDCDDGDPCTDDACEESVCQHLTKAVCCTAAVECDDGDPCTTDACVDNDCTHAPIPDCVPPTCGDGACDEGETCESCPGDCGECPTVSDCCSPHEEPGCDDAEVASCVCALDDFCCTVTWDDLCVEAGAGCGLECPACGDGACVEGETCAACPEDCGACPAGDCCAAHDGPGCDDADLMACVCATDDYCCDFEWDGLCVEAAIDGCGLVCAGPECGDGACEEGEGCVTCPDDCGACPTEGPCCEAHETPGCEDPAIVACGCALDPWCCELAWDELCIEGAVADCGLVCGGPECGDGACDEGESCESCAEDCGACPECGDGLCADGEGCLGCPVDCGPCEFEGDCCLDNGSPGCLDAGVSACTCALDSTCCEVSWDSVCAGIAIASCELDCAGPECGDGTCDEGEACFTCEADCGPCELEGDCCVPNGSPGCADAATTACTCQLDGYCCETDWDEVCVGEAIDECGLVCAGPDCGDGTCDLGESCLECPGDCGDCSQGDCCEENGSPGCEDPLLVACVCALDAYCCEVLWDAACVGWATDDCGLVCVPDCGDGLCGEDEDCLSCPTDCGACPGECGDGFCDASETCVTCEADCGACAWDGDCCAANGTPGCEDAVTTACVCAVDEYCCLVTWDGTCVERAQDDCGLACGASCGDGTCDEGEACFTCEADCGACAFDGACCGPNATPGCQDGDVSACVCGNDAFCCEGLWDDICVSIATDLCDLDCSSVCGDGTCDEAESCLGCEADCGPCAWSGDCCADNGTPGCDDLALTACTCDIDPFCCELAWDTFCVDEAIVSCGLDCGGGCGDGLCASDETCEACPEDCGECPPPKGACCEAGTTAGCEDAACEALVCTASGFCCVDAWDGLCVDIALQVCDVCGGAPPVCGDGACGLAEDCESCEADCGACPPPGDCCEGHVGKGCADAACEAAVCAEDDFCCTVLWDVLCAESAADLCDICGAVEPVCGDATCDATETCALCPEDCGVCPPPEDCCHASGAPGCVPTEVQDCVCAFDAFCCELAWDETCVTEAKDDCGLVCVSECGDGFCDEDETCVSCLADCGECPPDCCAPRDDGGCGDAGCQALICAGDPYCCETQWDSSCAAAAVAMCTICGGTPPACGDGACNGFETCADCAEDCGACPTCGDGTCDGDETCADCAEDCGACPEPGDCCLPGDSPGCLDGDVAACVCAVDDYCCNVLWDAFCVATAVESCALVCTYSCGDGVCFGDGEDCESCAEDCGACPPKGDCCEAHGGVGCDDAECEALVCGADGFCCALAWDEVCASIAAGSCAACGGTPPVCGDGACEPTESCGGCPEDCGVCPEPGDCCQLTGAAGCTDPVVEACTCAEDSWCCDTEWDQACVDLAATSCGLVCEALCGDGTCDADETCEGCAEDCGACPEPGDCCTASGGLGCLDAACQTLVCVVDPFCCATGWDATCAAAAATFCEICGGTPPVCGDGACDAVETCDGCPEDCGACPAPGPCCEVSEIAGCDDPIVMACVCADDAYCCDVAWDEVCVTAAIDGCALECGSACGDGTCDADETCESCVEDCGACPTCGDGTCDADETCELCPADCGTCPEPGDCCVAHDGPGCADPACQDLVCAEDAFCCDTTWDETCAAIAGAVCAACAEPSVCGDGACTGVETCADCAEDCGVCPEPGDCCHPTEAAGCTDAAVQACVCALDDFCCQLAWDEICVADAMASCGLVCASTCGDAVCDLDETCEGCPEDCGACPGPGDCCSDSGGLGCEDATCSALVCGEDPFCCDTVWDDICAAAAALVCEVCGGTPPPCGDGTCNGLEDCATCPEDCGACPTCGDAACNGDEDCASCPEDCGACPELGPCCEPAAVGGCLDQAVMDCLCADDPYCCDTLWDDICVEEAIAGCGLVCEAICGDGSCVAGEDCAGCPEDCGECPPAGDCCAENLTPSCEDAACAAAVCTVDPLCCEMAWDQLCVLAATELCEVCGATPAVCGDAICSAGETCEGCPEDCGECPEPGDCCAATAGVGCSDAACADAVCAIDPFCCVEAWDELCAEAALEACAICAPPEPVCGDATCEASESCATCPADCGACGECGDGACAPTETCYSCPGDCGACAYEGSCCLANGTPGCDDAAVVTCTCLADPYCCELDWDDVCMGEAIDLCALDCPGGCGDGVCGAAETCADCEEDCGPCQGSGSCCEDNGTPGCEDEAVAQCVCAFDGYCCEGLWDDVCAAEAMDECALDCGVVCGDEACSTSESCYDCPSDCGACAFTGDCCAPQTTPGCDDADMVACACGLDAFCCEVQWDEMCVGAATLDCGLVCVSFCGDGACDAEEGCVGCPEDCGACEPGDCCTPQATPGCEDATVTDCVCGTDGYCCTVEWDESCIAFAEASCDLVCAPSVCGDGLCDALAENCGSCPEDCGPCEGGCCEAHLTGGCADAAITTCVCDIDPFCCTTEWDAICAESAAADCGAPCGGDCGNGTCDEAFGEDCLSCEVDCGACPPKGDCCAVHDGVGCADATCETDVCAQDDYCCTTIWDEVCVGYAVIACGICAS